MNTTPKNPLKDTSFYAALLTLAIAFTPQELKTWVAANPESVAPLSIWLVTHGWLRSGHQTFVGHDHSACLKSNAPAGDPPHSVVE